MQTLTAQMCFGKIPTRTQKLFQIQNITQISLFLNDFSQKSGNSQLYNWSWQNKNRPFGRNQYKCKSNLLVIEILLKPINSSVKHKPSCYLTISAQLPGLETILHGRLTHSNCTWVLISCSLYPLTNCDLHWHCTLTARCTTSPLTFSSAPITFKPLPATCSLSRLQPLLFTWCHRLLYRRNCCVYEPCWSGSSK